MKQDDKLTTALARFAAWETEDGVDVLVSRPTGQVIETRLALPAEDFDRLVDALERPPEPTERLRALMAPRSPNVP